MAFLTKEEIFAFSDIVTEELVIPQWGGTTLRVKGLTAADRDAYEASIITQKGKNTELNRNNFRAKLVVLCVVDEAGNRVFDDTDIRKLGKKSAAAIDLIYGTAARLTGISEQDEEDLIKNSESDQSDDSSSV